MFGEMSEGDSILGKKGESDLLKEEGKIIAEEGGLKKKKAVKKAEKVTPQELSDDEKESIRVRSLSQKWLAGEEVRRVTEIADAKEPEKLKEIFDKLNKGYKEKK